MSLTSPKDVERFNKWAVTYEKSVAQRWYFGPIHLAMLDLLDHERQEKPPCFILDVGCGTGRLLRATSVRWPHAQLFGADPAERMVSEAGRLNPSATFTLAFSESLPFPGQSFDLVFSSLSLHHWANQAKGLKEIARVLRRGGWFCLADYTIPGWIACLFGEKVKSFDQIRGLIQAAGLSVMCQKRLWARFAHITLACK